MTVQLPPPAPYPAPVAPVPLPPLANPPARRGRFVVGIVALVAGLIVVLVGVIATVGGNGDKPAAPVGLHMVDRTATTVTLAWSPAAGTQPTLYRLYRDGVRVDTTAGTRRATDVGLTPLSTHRYQVAAYEDGNWSDRSAAVSVRTSHATLAQAHLSGGYDVKLAVTNEYGYTHIASGDRDTASWWFDTRANGKVVLKGEGLGGGWTMRLTRSGNTYSGSTHAVVSQCSYVPVNTAIRASLNVKKARVVNGEWTVARFTGTYGHTAPAASAGLITCPGAGFTSTVVGTVQR